MKRIINKNTVLLILLCAAASCIHEAEPGWGKTEGPLPVKLNLHLPSDLKGDASVRSIAVENESVITSVELLAFLNDGSGNFQYLYNAPIESTVNTNGQVEIVAMAQGYSGQQVFMVLVNAPEGTSSGIVQNMSLTAARQQLLVTEANEWNATSSADYKPLPMYAETLPSTITAGTTLGDYDLVRMIARIDVRLKAGMSNFEITEAHLFNRKTSGQMAFPFDDATWDAAGKRVRKTTYPQAVIPNEYRPSYYDSPGFTYTPYKADNTVDARGEILRSIYTFEANGVSEADRLEATAVIVGGKYNGSNDVTYYRIDIVTAATPADNCSQDILRNHLYDIEIQNIAVAGFPTPEEAFIGKKPIDFTVSVTNWGGEYDVLLPIPERSSNCFIVESNGGRVSIPVYSQIYWAYVDGGLSFDWMTSDMTLGAEIVWAESANVIQSLSLTSVGHNKRDYLNVTTGSAQGNALVAIFNDIDGNGVRGTGENILWSWHIWVLNANNMPQVIGGVMDRDLGATSNAWVTLGSMSDPVLGLSFQWGRKDPLRVAYPSEEYTKPALVGTITTESSGPGNTLSFSIRNPTVRITDWKNQGRIWETTDGKKSIFDPCPQGWHLPKSGDVFPLPTYTRPDYWTIYYSERGGYYPAIYNHGGAKHWKAWIREVSRVNVIGVLQNNGNVKWNSVENEPTENNNMVRCVRDNSNPAGVTPTLSTDSDGRKILTDGATYNIAVTSNTQWEASIKRRTNEVTSGDASVLGLSLLNETTGFNGGAISAYISGKGNGTITVTTTDYYNPFVWASGDLVIVFRDKATGELLNQTTITVWEGVAPHLARSNIVLNADGTLTFAVTKEDNQLIPATSQGLMFKFGSLVGLAINGGHRTTYSPPSVVFNPSNKVATTNYLESIPYFDFTSNVSNGNNGYNYDDLINYYPTPVSPAINGGYDESNGIGDICRYITDKGWVKEGRWRTPTAYELILLFEETGVRTGGLLGLRLGDFSSTITIDNTIHGPTDGYGWQPMLGGWMYGCKASINLTNNDIAEPPMGTVFFPTNGYIHGETGQLSFQGQYGNCWYSTTSSTTDGYSFGFGPSVVNHQSSNQRQYGFAIRCIRTDK